MKKILITGGAGFIGYHLANKLLVSGYHIDLIDDFSRGVRDVELNILTKNKNVNIINMDLLQTSRIKHFGKDYTFIYHLAAVVGVRHVLKAPFEVLTKNYILLNNALEIAKRQKALKKFVFTSTSEIYAGTLMNYGLEFPTPESTPLTISDLSENRSSYMLSKIYGETMCLHSGLATTIIRPHNFYGPRMGLSHVIPELMKKIVECKSNQLDVFSVSHKRTFCYILDAVSAIQMLAESKSSIGKTYNIGSDDEEITMGELSKKMIKMIGKKIDINPLPNTEGSPERRCPSIEKLKKDTQFKKQFSLDDGLQETYNWYKAKIFSGRQKSAQ